MASHLEQRFAAAWVVRCPDLPFEREYRLPAWVQWAQERKMLGMSKRAHVMRADFAWPAAKVAVEVQGGIWIKGGHSSGSGIDRDAAKSFLAQADGWMLAAMTERMFTRQAEIWLPRLEEAIRARWVLHVA